LDSKQYRSNRYFLIRHCIVVILLTITSCRPQTWPDHGRHKSVTVVKPPKYQPEPLPCSDGLFGRDRNGTLLAGVSEGRRMISELAAVSPPHPPPSPRTLRFTTIPSFHIIAPCCRTPGVGYQAGYDHHAAGAQPVPRLDQRYNPSLDRKVQEAGIAQERPVYTAG
jgi:hypothetical protein